MRRRMEDKIRDLCSQVIAEQDPEKFTTIILELRTALRIHIQNIPRKALSNTPHRRAEDD
jgi:hypothetical protein